MKQLNVAILLAGLLTSTAHASDCSKIPEAFFGHLSRAEIKEAALLLDDPKSPVALRQGRQLEGRATLSVLLSELGYPSDWTLRDVGEALPIADFSMHANLGQDFKGDSF